MQTKRIPGLQVYVSKGGSVLYHEAFGLASAGAGTPMTKETATVLASVSKPFTAAVLMTLYDQGRYGLDDPINTVLPFKVEHPDFKATDITFRMLLTHQSGILDGPELTYQGDPPLSLNDYMRGRLIEGGAYYDKDAFGAKPGTEYRYSNDGVALMGYLVEVLSGMSFEAYSRQALFDPLGMTSTSWFLSGVAGKPVAHPHGEWNPTSQSYPVRPHPGFADYPSGQLRTTAEGVGRFLEMFHKNGSAAGRQVLKPETVTAMLTPQVQNIEGGNQAVGLIWFQVPRDGRLVWEHDGSIAGITTYAGMLTDEDVSVVLLANGENLDVDAIRKTLFDYAIQRNTASEAPVAPAGVVLTSVSPNPIATEATIRFRLAEAVEATADVFDALGRRVAVLAAGPFPAGDHQLTWATRDVPSGTYLVRLRAGGVAVSRVVSVVAR